MTKPVVVTTYPFGVIEEERKSEIGGKVNNRNSMSVHSSRHDSETDSFISAPDSPSALQRQIQD